MFIYSEVENGGSLEWHKAREAKESDIPKRLADRLPNLIGMYQTECGKLIPGEPHELLPENIKKCFKCFTK